MVRQRPARATGAVRLGSGVRHPGPVYVPPPDRDAVAEMRSFDRLVSMRPSLKPLLQETGEQAFDLLSAVENNWFDPEAELNNIERHLRRLLDSQRGRV